MAMLIKADGSTREATPENGTNFSIGEILALLESDVFEITDLKDDKTLISIDGPRVNGERGLNIGATLALHETFGPLDQIYGPALFCRADEVI